jgi:hypothetical protein
MKTRRGVQLAVNHEGTGQSGEDPGQFPKRVVQDVLRTLDADDEQILRLWFESLALQDPRYDSKGIGGLAQLAMADEEFRSRLVNDTESLLEELDSKVHIRAHLPEGVTLKFFDNTADTLNVVLPSRSGVRIPHTPALREMLQSRTSAEGLFQDNWNLGDAVLDNGDGRDKGDPMIDPPIFQTQ